MAMAKMVVTTLPEFAWVVKRLDTSIEVISLLEGSEDPHFVDATPSFIFKIAKADMVVMNGMELEIGWLPKVLQQSGNKKVQTSTGLCDASFNVEKIEIMQNATRAMGDIHPAGNPHYTLSPKQMVKVALAIKNCLEQVYSKSYQESFNLLKIELDVLDQELKTLLQDKHVYVFHREFNYLSSDYGLKIGASLEEIPGVLPSASFLTKIALLAKKDRPSKVLASNTSADRILEKFKEMTKINYVKLRLHPKTHESYGDFIRNLFQMIKHD
jgi:zinc/manganese transport system substrate-binding protein